MLFHAPPQGQLGGLVCYGDASTCRAALINDRRAWGADASLWGERPRACKRAGRPECSCARYAGPDGRGRPANVEFVHLLYRSPASGALAPVILAKTTRDLAAGDELLTDYEAQRCSSYFPIVAENALSYSYCRLLERLGEVRGGGLAALLALCLLHAALQAWPRRTTCWLTKPALACPRTPPACAWPCRMIPTTAGGAQRHRG